MTANEAGRELDALIAVEVMGLDDLTPAQVKDGYVRIWPSYSTTYEGAGLVIEKMRELGCKWELGSFEFWHARVGKIDKRLSDDDFVFSATFPHVVCLAALAAVRSA